MTNIDELIARSNEITRSAIINSAERAKQSGKAREEILAEKNAWLADLGTIPQWASLIEESYNSLI